MQLTLIIVSFVKYFAVRTSLFINSKLETNYIWFKSQIEFLFELPKLDYEGGGHKLKSFFLFGEKIKLHDIAQIKTQSHLFASSIWYEKHNNGSIIKLWLQSYTWYQITFIHIVETCDLR